MAAAPRREAGLKRKSSPTGPRRARPVPRRTFPRDGVRPRRELEAPIARAAGGVQTHRQPRRGGPPVLARTRRRSPPPRRGGQREEGAEEAGRGSDPWRSALRRTEAGRRAPPTTLQPRDPEAPIDERATLRQAWPREEPGAAKCVRSVDDQCVLQFTLVLAASCVLHRRTSRVIHR